MMLYEVTIPGARGPGLDEVLQVQAPSWRDAYTTALARISATPDLANASVMVADGHVRVTEPRARRTVDVRVLRADALHDQQVIRAIAPEPPPVHPRHSESGAHRQVGFTQKATGSFRSIGSAEVSARSTGMHEARVLAQTSVPASASPAVDPPGAAPSHGSAAADRIRRETRHSVAALEDVFLEIPAIFEPGFAMEDAIDFVVDLAMKHIASEHALLMFASDQADHLYAAAVRSPKEKALMDARFSIHDGIPSESLRNGVSLALVEPSRDTRYTEEFRRFGIHESSIAIAPIQSNDRAFGVIVLINRVGRGFYSADDSNVLAYLGLQMGALIEQQLDAAPLE